MNSKTDGKRMTLLVECEDCKHKFEITSNEAAYSITHKKEFNANGQSIFLTYYDCPKCGRRHFVQIDDVKSKQELTKVSLEFIRLAAAKKKGKVIPKKKSEKLKKAQQHLSEYRRTLMKEFTGKLIYDSETGTEFELRFSV